MLPASGVIHDRSSTPRKMGPHVEEGIILILAIAAVGASMAASPSVMGVLGAALALLMLAIAVIDARHFIIPNPLSAAALALACLQAAVLEPHAVFVSLGYAAVRGIIVAIVFLSIRALYLRLRGTEGLGLGDVKLAGVAGAWLDWPMVPLALEIAALAALGYYGLVHLLGRRTIHATTRIPFGLFFAPAIWIAWLLQVILMVS